MIGVSGDTIFLPVSVTFDSDMENPQAQVRGKGEKL